MLLLGFLSSFTSGASSLVYRMGLFLSSKEEFAHEVVSPLLTGGAALRRVCVGLRGCCVLGRAGCLPHVLAVFVQCAARSAPGHCCSLLLSLL